jgi:hypothetical protein
VNRKAHIRAVTTLLALAWHPVVAQDDIPKTSGFSGFAIAGGAYFNVASNLLAGGSPIVLDDVGDPQIASLFDAPPTNSSPGLVAGGELNSSWATASKTSCAWTWSSVSGCDSK